MQARQYPKHQLDALQQQLNNLKLQAEVLNEQQRFLKVQHGIAAASCEILHAIRTGAVHKGWGRLKGGLLPEELPLLLDLGFQLDLSQVLAGKPELQQIVAEHQQQQQAQQQDARVTRSRAAKAQPTSLRTKVKQQLAVVGSVAAIPWQLPHAQASTAQSSSVGCMRAAAAAANGTSAHCARVWLVPGEYLGPLKYSLQQPPWPGAAALTLDVVVEHYTRLVKDVSFSLHLLDHNQDQEDGMCSHSEQHLLRLKELQLLHARFIFSIQLLNPDDLVNSLRIVNMETRELSDTIEQAHSRMCWLTDRLDLSAEQQQALIAGGDLFTQLLDTVRAERQQLLAQQQAQLDQRLPSGRAVDLQGQQDMADRLRVLVRKELLLLAMASAFTASVLDVRQIARAVVLTWPWVPNMGMLAGIVAAQHAKQQKQEQDQHSHSPAQQQQRRELRAASLQQQPQQEQQQEQQQQGGIDTPSPPQQLVSGPEHASYDGMVLRQRQRQWQRVSRGR